jgi:hypothetical protein
MANPIKIEADEFNGCDGQTAITTKAKELISRFPCDKLQLSTEAATWLNVHGSGFAGIIGNLLDRHNLRIETVLTDWLVPPPNFQKAPRGAFFLICKNRISHYIFYIYFFSSHYDSSSPDNITR